MQISDRVTQPEQSCHPTASIFLIPEYSMLGNGESCEAAPSVLS